MLCYRLARRVLRDLDRNDRGSPAVEFAFAAPFLFLMIVGTLELGLIMFVTILMEASLRDAARFGITGLEPDSISREAHIVDLIDRRTLGLVDMSAADISILTYPTFGSVGQGETFVDGNGNGVYDSGETFDDVNGNGSRDEDIGVDGPGGAGRVVVYRIDYDWPILTPLASSVIGTGGTFKLRASMAARNEPWESDGS